MSEENPTKGVSLGDVDREGLIQIRRHLHQHPELSEEEHETAAFIERVLDRAEIPFERVVDTGVVAVIEGDRSGPTLLWRADIDALPIQEENEVAYRSACPGVMHACGHDVHTTVGLGIAAAIKGAQDRLAGRLVIVFQPAEEAPPRPDRPVGAERLFTEGVLDEIGEIDAAFALHCMPSLEVGKIGYTGGPVWADSNLVQIQIEGRKAHAAYPHEGCDAVVVAAQVVVALQTIAARRVDSRTPCVLTIGELHAGDAYNILAESATLTGILRTHDAEVTEWAKAEVTRTVEQVAKGLGASATVAFVPGAKPTVNDAEVERRLLAAIRHGDAADALTAHLPQMGAEDFSAISTRIPSCYLFLGIRNEERGIVHELHTPRFDVDEACIPFAVETFANAILDYTSTP